MDAGPLSGTIHLQIDFHRFPLCFHYGTIIHDSIGMSSGILLHSIKKELGSKDCRNHYQYRNQYLWNSQGEPSTEYSNLFHDTL